MSELGSTLSTILMVLFVLSLPFLYMVGLKCTSDYLRPSKCGAP